MGARQVRRFAEQEPDQRDAAAVFGVIFISSLSRAAGDAFKIMQLDTLTNGFTLVRFYSVSGRQVKDE